MCAAAGTGAGGAGTSTGLGAVTGGATLAGVVPTTIGLLSTGGFWETTVDRGGADWSVNRALGLGRFSIEGKIMRSRNTTSQ